MSKVPMITTEDYILYLENVDDVLFIHCDVFKWNKTVKSNLLEALNTMQSFVNQPLFATRIGAKTIKFAKLFGFKYLKDIIDHETGETIPVYWRELNG